MNLQTLQQREDKFLFDMKALVETATTESRPLTDDEKKSYADWERGLTDVGKQIEKFTSDEGGRDQLLALTGHRKGQSTTPILVRAVDGRKTFGQQLVESEAFAWLGKTRGTRSGQWTTDAVEIERKALTEDPASGGALVAPDYQNRIVPGSVLPIVVADLLAPGTTDSNMVPVTVEKTFTNAAAPVAEGAVKPESALIYELQNEPVRKIAHWLPASEEVLEDQAAVASLINERLAYGLFRKEDQQILFGTGVSPELLGILNRPGLGADVARVDPATNADAILMAITILEATTGLRVSGVVMNPLAWGAIQAAKLTTGEYLAGGPFGTQTAPTIWNRQVALTDQITATTAVVGAFKQGAQIFRRGGVQVATTNAHADFFVRNMVAFRSELRLALSVTRASAFCKVTGLTTVPLPVV